MADGRAGTGAGLNNDLETLFTAGSFAGLTDAELLARFLAGGAGGGAAFEALVSRHGPTVWRVCRAALGDPDDAHDAFQATFLVLVRKAGSVRRRDSLASWLFGVADRVCARARADAARRLKHERRGAAMTPGFTPPPRDRDDLDGLAQALHEEIARLPERHRAAVVLCDLEERSYEDAARALGCPLGTLKAWLFRGRAKLRDRLTRRGLASPGVGFGFISSKPPAFPAVLARETARAVSAYATHNSAAVAAGVVSARAAAWTDGVISTMFLTQLKLTAAGLVAVTLSAGLTGAAILAAPRAVPDRPGQAAEAPKPKPKPVDGPAPLVLTAADVSRLALDAAVAIPDAGERAEALLSLGQAEARRGETEAAKATLRLAFKSATAIPPNTHNTFPHPIIRIAEAQADAGDGDGARRTFTRAAAMVAAEDIQHHQIQNWINLLPRQLRIEGRAASETTVELYRQYLDEEALRFGPEFRTIALVKVRAQSRDFDGAMRMAETLKGPDALQRKKEAVLGVVDAVGQGDREAAAPALAEARKVVEAADTDFNRIMKAQDLAVIARALARVGRFEDAIATNREGPTDGLPGDFGESARFNKSMGFVDIAEMQLKAGDRAGSRVSAGLAAEQARATKTLPMKIIPYLRAGIAMARAGALTEALGVADELTNPELRSRLLVEIATAQDRAGDGAAARATLARALREAEEKRATATIADLQARLGDLAAAVRTVDTLEMPAARDDAFARLAASRAGAGDLASARSLVGRVNDPKARERAWIGVACALPAAKP